MPQLAIRQRGRWAVLAAGALVSSVMAVEAAPAAAEQGYPDAASTWRACLGEATESHGFSDVSPDGVHYHNINCLAYYGITVGKTESTFDPGGHVTRSQMALFLARAADVAGIDLGEDMDVGFTDIGDADDERRRAINRLVGAGIMFGDTATSFDPPSTNIFGPNDNVTRWEMAMFLFAFLDHALDSVLIDSIPADIDGDGTGHVELNSPDGLDGTPPDDYFGDARRQTPAHMEDRINAIYELGVTTGDNSRVGEGGRFGPSAFVTRAQMASFIMRTLGHTNLRPVGLTAQSTSNQTQVSVRDESFAPVAAARVEMISADFPDVAFDDHGECVTDRFVTDIPPSREPCRIDNGDELTDDDGNAIFDVGSRFGGRVEITCSNGVPLILTPPRRDPMTDFTLWAWSGAIGDTVDDETARFETVPANVVSRQLDAVKSVVSGGTSTHVRMGGVLSYTVQLVDRNGDRVGPSEGVRYDFTALVTRTRQSVDAVSGSPIEDDPGTDLDEAFDQSTDIDRLRLRETFVPDRFGRFTVTVRVPDQAPLTDNRDVRVQVTLTPVPGNELPILDMAMPAGTIERPEPLTSADTIWTSAPVRFSDNEPRAAEATLTTVPWTLWLPFEQNSNSLHIVVLDQYGGRFANRAGRYYVTASASGDEDQLPMNSDPSVEDARYFRLPAASRMTFSYRHRADRPLVQTVGVSGRVAVIADGAVTFPAGEPADMQLTSAMGTVVWAEQGDRQAASGVPLMIADARGNSLVVDQADGVNQDPYPAVYRYSDYDRFFVEGIPVDMDRFEEVLTSPEANISGPDDPDAEITADNAILSWTGPAFQGDNFATWRLNGLICHSASQGGD